MSIKEKFVEVALCSANIKHYEKLNYPIPRYIDNRGRLKVKEGTKIWVKVSDLLPDSTVKITAICECCDKERILSFRDYRDICHDCFVYSKENRLKHSGENNPMFGKKHSEETKEKIGKAQKGKSKSKETKRKMRTSALKRIERNLREGYQLTPFWNPVACDLIEQYGSTNGFNFQTAKTGGEHYIKEIGYFLDGYDSEKNVAIEIYEPFHFKNQEKIDHDIQRQKEIQDYLHCDFIIIIVDKNNNILKIEIFN